MPRPRLPSSLMARSGAWRSRIDFGPGGSSLPSDAKPPLASSQSLLARPAANSGRSKTLGRSPELSGQRPPPALDGAAMQRHQQIVCAAAALLVWVVPAGAAPLVVLVHDRGRVAVGEAVLVAQPVDALVEAQQAGVSAVSAGVECGAVDEASRGCCVEPEWRRLSATLPATAWALRFTKGHALVRDKKSGWRQAW